MISIGELIEQLQLIGNEYGTDCLVCLQLYNNVENKLIGGDYCFGIRHNQAGTIFLDNRYTIDED